MNDTDCMYNVHYVTFRSIMTSTAALTHVFVIRMRLSTDPNIKILIIGVNYVRDNMTFERLLFHPLPF